MKLQQLLCCTLLVIAAGTASAQSLYDEKTYRPAAADNRAFRVGDVLTIQIVENASATANADTGTRRNNDMSAELARPHLPAINAGLGVRGDFDGGGRTTRSGKLVAQLTVSVAEVMPNGDLRITGQQLLLINDEKQRINVEGRVRPQDISDANVVISSRLADAKITYVGEGELAARQKPAWWRQFMDWVGL
ncbi:flagellar L-ring protein precursor FlgH [Roseateles sp. YR242]|uniref:flagellar basal body L-ring protein FlgH n=1 Tax=Roseateles sp. YR242 TaxID=1855305 RepID=UPI0008B6B38A|nr:flagellar basal body L-ring protein FlgH [Roseateles sp. YR242]SEK93244.1 flagellar L-ring protein precursor FlgH [Roseateles sp. YR242]